MFFYKKDTNSLLEVLEQIKLYINNDINKIPEIHNNCSSSSNKIIMDKILEISRLIQDKKIEDLLVFGEIMLCAEKLSDGYTHDRILKQTSDYKVAYIAKTINTMSERFEKSLNEIEDILSQYANQNFLNSIDEKMFRGGSLKNLTIGINYLKDEITKNLQSTYQMSLLMQQESSKLLENSLDLSNSTSLQAASLEEVSASIDEITSTISNNTNTAVKMSDFGSDVKVSISDGMKLASKTVVAMDEINSSTKNVQEALEMIDQIAFQTNILSLNAAVEAATAGEAGKGFAVVAQEVRNLATRSAEAARTIKELVENASTKANEGKVIADNMIKGYEVLNENITQTTQLIEQVVLASKEQESSILQINSTVSQIDSLTQKNAVVADNVKQASLKLDRIANENVEKVASSKFDRQVI